MLDLEDEPLEDGPWTDKLCIEFELARGGRSFWSPGSSGEGGPLFLFGGSEALSRTGECSCFVCNLIVPPVSMELRCGNGFLVTIVGARVTFI